MKSNCRQFTCSAPPDQGVYQWTTSSPLALHVLDIYQSFAKNTMVGVLRSAINSPCDQGPPPVSSLRGNTSWVDGLMGVVRTLCDARRSDSSV